MISELTIGRDPTFLEELDYQLCEGVLLEIDVTGSLQAQWRSLVSVFSCWTNSRNSLSVLMGYL
jgi:hypothetical protein